MVSSLEVHVDWMTSSATTTNWFEPYKSLVKHPTVQTSAKLSARAVD